MNHDTAPHQERAAPPRIAAGPEQGFSARVLQLLPAEPARPLNIASSWWVFAAAACASYAVLAAAVWTSAHVHPDPTLHNVALFVHLVSLVLGLGAVLVADYFVALWVLRRSTLAEAVARAGQLHVPIWIGLSGLVLSGVLLQPDLAAATTWVKLAFVAILTLNGLHAMVLAKRMEASQDGPSMRLLSWGAVTTTTSQACWWGAVVIGFLTANKL